jgi:HSP90 family molecular chaperone
MAKSYEMLFDIGTIKHLGLQMYSTLPPVIGELVSNAWDADAKRVEITIPTDQISISSEIVVQDTGVGMTEDEVKNAYLIVGRDRRKADGKDQTGQKRPIMGRKGIGKFSAFGIAKRDRD